MNDDNEKYRIIGLIIMEQLNVNTQNKQIYPVFSRSALKKALKITFSVLFFNLFLNILDFLFLSHNQSLDPFFDLSLVSSGFLIIIGATIALFESVDSENEKGQTKSKRKELKFFPTYEDNPYSIVRTVSKEEAIFQGKVILLSGFILFIFIIAVDYIAKTGGFHYVVVLNTLIFGYSWIDLHWFSKEFKSIDIYATEN